MDLWTTKDMDMDNGPNISHKSLQNPTLFSLISVGYHLELRIAIAFY
jgi:hypothetical protein